MIRLLIAEDQGVLSSALAMIVGLEEDIEVVGTAKDGEEATRMIRDFQPDLLLTDIEMSKKSGLDLAAELKNEPIKIIILTTFAREGYFERAVSADVAGYLLKDTPSEVLITHIRAAMAGKTYYEPALITNYISHQKNPLSQKEQEILLLITEGKTSKDISAVLYLSDGTVRNYISEIIGKLAAKNRIEAVAIARENGWI